MTIDTQEALRLLDGMLACAKHGDLIGVHGYEAQLRAMLSDVERLLAALKETDDRLREGLAIVESQALEIAALKDRLKLAPRAKIVKVMAGLASISVPRDLEGTTVLLVKEQ